MRRRVLFAVLAAALFAAGVRGAPISVPDVALLDQDGRRVQLHSDLVKDKIVVMNFIFTSCTTVCSPMGANFAALQKELGPRTDVRLISVSIDPETDTPARLRKWSRQFRAREGWTLVTGARSDVDRVLEAFAARSINKFAHTPLIVVGSDRSGEWTRVNGLASPRAIVEMIDRLTATAETPAQRYFGDVELVNQNGETMRLYTDVLRGKTVVINSFFATCAGSCPVMARGLAAIQARFSERLGKDLWIVSISVDPDSDTPARLGDYARRMQSRSGWLFLTGSKKNVEQALTRLGQYVEKKADHQNVMIIGNEKTGLWKKAFGMARPEELIKVVQSVLDDRG